MNPVHGHKVEKHYPEAGNERRTLYTEMKG